MVTEVHYHSQLIEFIYSQLHWHVIDSIALDLDVYLGIDSIMALHKYKLLALTGDFASYMRTCLANQQHLDADTKKSIFW